MAVIISARQFKANLARLAGEELKELVAATFAFALFQYHNHGQKTPFMEMQAAVVSSRSFMADIIKKLTLGRREKELSEEDAVRRADAAVAVAFADTKTKREIAKASRTPKAKPVKTVEPTEGADEKPEAEAVVEPLEGESKRVVVASALIIGGEVVEITAEEADMIYEALMAHRTEETRRLLKAA